MAAIGRVVRTGGATSKLVRLVETCSTFGSGVVGAKAGLGPQKIGP